MNRALVVTILLAVSGCCFGGVSDVAPATPGPSAAAAPVAPAVVPPPVPVPVVAPAPAEPIETIAARKSGMIADVCLNRFGEGVRRARDGYVQHMGDAATPRREEFGSNSVLNYVGAGMVAGCRAAVDRAIAVQPAVPEVDTAATTWIVALEALAPLATETMTYYERESFRDDAGARGRELHTQLLAAFTAFVEADEAMHGVVASFERRALDLRLAQLASDPAQRGVYLVERTRGCAMQVVDLATGLEVVPDGRRHRFQASDPAAVWSAVEACQTSTDEMIAAPETAAIDTGGSYRRDSGEFVAAALIIGRAVRDGTAYSREHEPRQLVGGLVSEYNSMIDDYNRF